MPQSSSSKVRFVVIAAKPLSPTQDSKLYLQRAFSPSLLQCWSWGASGCLQCSWMVSEQVLCHYPGQVSQLACRLPFRCRQGRGGWRTVVKGGHGGLLPRDVHYCRRIGNIRHLGGSRRLVKSCRLHKLLHAGGYRPGVPHDQYSQV